MQDVTVTFKLSTKYKKKLKAEPEKNRIFNTMSEIIRTMIELFCDDPSFKRIVNERAKRKFKEFYGLTEE